MSHLEKYLIVLYPWYWMVRKGSAKEADKNIHYRDTFMSIKQKIIDRELLSDIYTFHVIATKIILAILMIKLEASTHQ